LFRIRLLNLLDDIMRPGQTASKVNAEFHGKEQKPIDIIALLLHLVHFPTLSLYDHIPISPYLSLSLYLWVCLYICMCVCLSLYVCLSLFNKPPCICKSNVNYVIKCLCSTPSMYLLKGALCASLYIHAQKAFIVACR